MLKQITSASLTNSEVETAKKIGKGNFTRGVVFALEQSKGRILQTDIFERKHPRMLMLDSNDRDNAATIGNGSMSAGIRFAINNYSGLPPPLDKCQMPATPPVKSDVAKFKAPPPPKG